MHDPPYSFTFSWPLQIWSTLCNPPQLHKRYKLVEYAAKNGLKFEVMTPEKQKDNPSYSFLFDGERHNYFRYKLWLSVVPMDPSVVSRLPQLVHYNVM